jgi:MFS transporter, PPP family, 3-phenylpropionic acid transporter
MTVEPHPTPYWRLSSFYLFYFATIGALVPYWSLYLQGQGYSPSAIGELIAIIMATKIIAPNVWGWIADHTGRRMAIVRLASMLAAFTFTGVFVGGGYWWLALVLAVFSFFWNAALPQFEATTMTHLGARAHRYSSIRVWGSVGFIVIVVALGPLLDRYGTELLPAVLLVLLIGIWLSSLGVPERAAGHLHREHEPLRRVLGRPAVFALLLTCFLVQASHGPYYTFYSIYLEGQGYSRGAIGQLWALGVVAEIGVFLLMHRLLPAIGARTLLLVALGLTLVRWLLIGWLVHSLPLIILAQTLHAASFGMYHAVAILLIHRFFRGPLQGRGQALYSSLSFGAGGAVGSLYSGYLWVSVGPAWTYTAGALVSLAALLVTWWGVRDPD